MLVKLYQMTCRVELQGPFLEYLNRPEPVLLTWWHQDMLFNFVFLTRFVKEKKIATIVSHSADGDLAAYLVRKFGLIPVRGSSSKGGKEALDLLTEYVLGQKAIGVIVCDGPRPPGRVAKFGIVALAHKTGYPILTVRSWGERQYIFNKSWCKLILVYPFSRVKIWSEGPFSVPAAIKRDDLEGYRLKVETNLNRMADASESSFLRPAGSPV